MRDPNAPVAVVIVNFNGSRYTLDILAELDDVAGPPLHRLVVNNGSTDDSLAVIRAARPDIEVLDTGRNGGFAAGNLAGVRHLLADRSFDWFLFINNDVAVDPGFLPPLLAACSDPTVAAAGPKIYYHEPPDCIWAAGGRLRVRETVTGELGLGKRDGPRWSRPADVTYLTTCCLLVPRDVLERVGLFDPLYFIGVEDADWCRRALDAGYRLRYEPASRIWHKVAVSTGGGYKPLKTFHTGRSNTLFARRHFGPLRLALFLAANLATLPLAFLRELPRRNAGAVVAKARGILDGLRQTLPAPPGLRPDA